MMPFDAFLSSAMDAFTESPLGERGTESTTIGLAFAPDWISRDCRTYGRLRLDASGTLTEYVCGTASASSSSYTGQPLNDVRSFNTDTESEAAQQDFWWGPDGPFYAESIIGADRYLLPVDGAAIPKMTASNCSIPLDVDDPTRLVQYGTVFDPANVTRGAGSCGSGWDPSDPPAGILIDNDPTSGKVGGYIVYSRTSYTDGWDYLAGPWKFPTSYTAQPLVNETTDRLWMFQNGVADYKACDLTADAFTTSSTITLPSGKGNVSTADRRIIQWGSFLILRTSTDKVLVYHAETYLGELGSPWDSTHGNNQLSVGFGWLAVADRDDDEIHIWSLDEAGASFSFHSSVDPGHAVRTGSPLWMDVVGEAAITFVGPDSTDCKKLTYSSATDTWGTAGEVSAVSTLLDDGYTLNHFSTGTLPASSGEGFVVLEKSGATPPAYLVRV